MRAHATTTMSCVVKSRWRCVDLLKGFKVALKEASTIRVNHQSKSNVVNVKRLTRSEHLHLVPQIVIFVWFRTEAETQGRSRAWRQGRLVNQATFEWFLVVVVVVIAARDVGQRSMTTMNTVTTTTGWYKRT